MARKGRTKSSMGLYHAVLRGQEKLFLSAVDYTEFKNVLKRYFQNTDSYLYAYSLDENKIHLVFYTSSDIGIVMKPLLTSYARYINRIYNKSGKLFYDRYMSEPIEDEAVLIDSIIFVNEKKAVHTSKTEYFGEQQLCAVDKLDKKSINKIKTPDIIYPFIDDYASMKDSELKKYILSLGIKDKEKLLDIALEYSNLSKTRIEKILGITKVKPIVRKPRVKKEEEPVKQQKQELSVWLL